MSWRPEGWSDTLRAKTDEWNKSPKAWTFDNFIEFGADAMLEALRYDALQHLSEDDWCVDLDLSNGTAGCIVFIPDEEKVHA